MINWSEFPVTDMSDYVSITVDAIALDSGDYQAQFGFWRYVADTGSSEPSQGFVLITGLVAPSLAELYLLVDPMIAAGFFTGVDVQGNGTLWSSEGDEITDICWEMYSDLPSGNQQTVTLH